jgi:hypothetical protein
MQTAQHAPAPNAQTRGRERNKKVSGICCEMAILEYDSQNMRNRKQPEYRAGSNHIGLHANSNIEDVFEDLRIRAVADKPIRASSFVMKGRSPGYLIDGTREEFAQTVFVRKFEVR